MFTSKLSIKKTINCFLLLTITQAAFAQKVMQIDKASFAEFPPSGVENLRNYRYSYKQLAEKYPFYLHESTLNKPVPTNDWWTDAIFSQYAGEMWAYPHAVLADSNGIKVIYPDGFNNGALIKTNFLSIQAETRKESKAFKPHSAKPINWGDLNMQFRCEDDYNCFMDVSISHGSPIVWVELEGLNPILKPSAEATLFDSEGMEITEIPVKGNSFSLQNGEKYYGIHTPEGTSVEKSNNLYKLVLPKDKEYIVISVLPEASLLNTFDKYARNKIANSIFEYSYNTERGEIETTFKLETKNLENNKSNEPTLISFLPHHYRNTGSAVNFISKANYQIHLGQMKTSFGNSFSFTYKFTGLPPHLGKPKNMSTEQTARLNQMVDNFKKGKYHVNTYHKTLDEWSEMMLITKQINHPKHNHFKETLKKELINWLTYQENEAKDTGLFFARYPQYGALIGFTPGYDSQAFNDQHFHYGYFVLAASRLMLLDEDFKNNYAEIIKLIAKNYANWERWDGKNENEKLPFLRTFDPYAGHSWASGISYITGPDQESTSEAVMSWFALFNLGLVLNDKELISLGAMGYTLESETTLEYYFNFYGNNFPKTYNHKYVGILHAGDIRHDTWFSKDPAWVFGIQSVPSAHYCSYLAKDDKLAEENFNSAIQERVNQGFIETTDLYQNILNMNNELGYYILGNYANFNPQKAINIQEQIFNEQNNEWKYCSQAVMNYYLSNAILTYGKPASQYHTSLPGAAVYKNSDGKLSYIIYNHTNENKDVKIYKNDETIKTISVKAKEFYCR